MPRKPKFEHPLRIIRQEIGLSQPQFASKVGCSAVTIEKIENGKLEMSDSLALRIRIFTGAVQFKDKASKPLDYLNEKPYSKAFFEWYQSKVMKSTPQNALKFFNQSKDWLQLAYFAACRPGVNKLAAFRQAFVEWLDKAKSEFQLDNQVAAILKEFPRKETFCVSYGELREKPYVREFAAFYGIKDDPSKSPEEEVSSTRTVYTSWSPGGECPDISSYIKQQLESAKEKTVTQKVFGPDGIYKDLPDAIKQQQKSRPPSGKVQKRTSAKSPKKV